jgi:polar amino acid transport system substrate-binding protein
MTNFLKRACIKPTIFSISIIFITISSSYSEPLKVGASFAPPYYTVEGENVTGVFGDLITKVFKEAGLEFVWKPYPTKRVYQNLIEGKIDIYLGPIKASLKGFNESVIHSDFSPVNIELRSYYFGEKPEITKKEELSGKNLLIIRGYTYGGLVNFILDPKNKVKSKEINSFEQAIEMLKANRADYHLDYKKTGEIYLKNNSEPDLRHSTIFNVNLYFMVSKHTPDHEKLLSILENAFRKLKEKE